ncbi:SigE family RNA polymerase sigma factor [Longispora sp. K20-0274]|uniref:SigE family RNA polymerase sigma factor n=1 Tax=Longispora sp. K20-0274 TaxID=3088255 RepID=UPI00399BD38F
MRFEDFVDSRLDALLRYAVVLTGDPHLAQDVVQETMVRAQVKWRRICRADRPEPYVKRMLTNVYLDWRRGPWWRRVLLRGDDTPEPPVHADHAQAAVERDAMWLLLAGLPRRQRAAVVLRYYEGLADAEIADVLGCAVGTVRAHISRALATLRTQLGPVTAGGER